MKDLLIYDRGYDAIWFMLFHQIKKKDFIIRMRRNSIKEIEDFFILMKNQISLKLMNYMRIRINK